MKYIQIDAPRYSYYIDPKWRDYVRDEMGVIPRRRWTRRSGSTTTASKARGATGVVVAIHLCRGNNRSQWYAEGGYDPIAEKLFNQLDVDAVPARVRVRARRHVRAAALRAARTRRSSWVWSAASFAELESPDQLHPAHRRSSRYVPLENLALSPQCGFASTIDGNLLTEEEQWRKLQLVVDSRARSGGRA